MKKISVFLISYIGMSTVICASETDFFAVQSDTLQCGSKQAFTRANCQADENQSELESSGIIRKQCNNVQLVIQDRQTEIIKDYPFVAPWLLENVQNRGYSVKEPVDLSKRNPYSPLTLGCLSYQSEPFLFVSYMISPDDFKFGDFDPKLSYLIDNVALLDLQGYYLPQALSDKINQNFDKLKYTAVDANVIFKKE